MNDDINSLVSSVIEFFFESASSLNRQAVMNESQESLQDS